MFPITVYHYNHFYQQTGEAFAKDYDFQLQLNKPESINYQMSLDNYMASLAYTSPDQSDYIVYYKDKPIFGGMHTEVNVNDVDANILEVAGQGWLHYFEGRFWPPTKPDGTDNDPYSATGKDIVAIAEDLLGFVSVWETPISLQIYWDNMIAGNLIDYDVQIGDTESIFSKVEALSRTNPGFDFEITWDRILKIYSPKKGSQKNYSFEQGMNCGPVSYRNQGIGGNYFFGTGTQGGSSLTSVSRNDASIADRRRKDITKDYGEMLDGGQGLLDSLSYGDAVRQSTAIRQISLTWMGDPNINNIFDEVALGDSVRVRADSGYEYVDDWFRIVGIEAQPSDADDERLVFTFDDGSLPL